MENYDLNKKIVTGIIFVIAGTLLLLDKLNVLPYFLDELFLNFQMILISIGIVKLTNPYKRTNGLIFIAIGTFLLIPDILNLGHDYWAVIVPSALILTGVLILLRGKINKPLDKDNQTVDAQIIS